MGWQLMGTELATRTDPDTTQLPGDFKRHPYTGAPMVSDPTKRNKVAGKKADLLAMCEEHGIKPPSKATNKKLIELLEDAGAGGPAPMVQYGRPSSFGKQIENSTNLQKWAERMVAWGVARIAVDGVDLTDLYDVDPDNRDDRGVLDGLAVDAKRKAQADLAAERGTHTHELTEDRDEGRDPIERMRSGENLGMPKEAQEALVAAWDQMQSAGYFEVLAVEAKCVDDNWRLAGTLDRVVRLLRDITFYCFGGEIVTLKKGTVLILDVKTGQLRLGNQGEPIYWHGYAIQVASYAQSKRYDPETNIRSEWEWDIDQKWAIIAHLDVLSALNDGEAVCRLILVDLEAGREAGDLVVAAKAWEKRRDVFSIVGAAADEVVFSVPVESPEPTPATEETPCPTFIPSETTTPSNSEAISSSSETPPSDVSSPSSPATPSSSAAPSFEPFPPLATSSIPSPTPATTPTPSPSTTVNQPGPTSSEPSPIPTFPSFGESPPSSSSSETSSTPTGTNTTTASTPMTEAAPSPTTDFPPIGIPATTAPSTGSTNPTTDGATSPTATAPADSPPSSSAVTTTAPTGASGPDALLAELPGEIVDYATQQTDDLKALAHEIETFPEYTRQALARIWPDPSVLPTPGQVRRGEATWTVDNIDLLRTLLNNAEAPFQEWNRTNPVPVTEQAFVTAPPQSPDLAPIDGNDLAVLLDTAQASPHLDTINRWLKDGHENERPWSVRKMPNVVNFERTRLALKLAEFCDGDEALAQALLEPFRGPVGETIGSLSASEAQDVANRVDDLAAGRATLLYGPDGTPSVVPSVSAS